MKKIIFLNLILYSINSIYSQVNAGSDFTICKCDGNTRLNGKYTGDPSVCVGGLKYKWTSIPTDSTLLINDTLSSPNICPKVKTKYTLTADGKTDEVEVTVNDTASDVDFKWDTLKPYGWDDWEKFGNILNSGLKDTSEVPYQSIEMGKKIKVKLNIKNLPKSYECIYFNSSDETIATVTPEKATTNNFDIEISALKEGEVDIKAVVANKNGTLVKDIPKPTILKVFVRNLLPQKMKIIVVHQKDTSAGGTNYRSTSPFSTGANTLTRDSFLNSMNKIYQSAVVKWTFEEDSCTCNFDLNKDSKIDVRRFNTPEMQIVIDSCAKDHAIYDKVIFCVDNSHDFSAGFGDDVGKKNIFHHQNELAGGGYPQCDPAENLAHEIGHTFGLPHVNAPPCPVAAGGGLAKDNHNIMTYCINFQNFVFFLRHFQWIIIRP